MHLVLLFKILNLVFHGQYWYLVDTFDVFSYYGSHCFWSCNKWGSWQHIVIHWILECVCVREREREIIFFLSLIIKNTERILSCHTAISCGLGLENVLFTHVWSSRKCFMKMGSGFIGWDLWVYHMAMTCHRLFQGQKRQQPNVLF